ncbi:hypothetical protein K9N68_25040 [Kovacikia minuta CCNUW1]|uniref:hypothetical protein n=1 Tax=Kovacikia minuta TaxID=2931930 RepID=UPI001CC9B3CB|nr:hypothetical protein [Kovacikia minuta]UBF24892.1 hypothetical protein K9N68_25040 [Kovacikia minuta CCNUW1]
MKPSNSSISACRNCRYYVPEGRRGGRCDQLNVSVHSAWKACSLAIPPFSPAWENLEEIIIWQRRTLAAQEALAANLSPTEEESLVAEPVSVPVQPVMGIKALWM